MTAEDKALIDFEAAIDEAGLRGHSDIKVAVDDAKLLVNLIYEEAAEEHNAVDYDTYLAACNDVDDLENEVELLKERIAELEALAEES